MVEVTEIEYDMTTIRRQTPPTRRTWLWAVVVVALIGLAGVLVFVQPFGAQKIRGGTTPTGDTTPAAAGDGGDESGGDQEDASSSRDITFEISNLDGEDGLTDKIVIRTHPEWAPLGVEQFHVSKHQNLNLTHVATTLNSTFMILTLRNTVHSRLYRNLWMLDSTISAASFASFPTLSCSSASMGTPRFKKSGKRPFWTIRSTLPMQGER